MAGILGQIQNLQKNWGELFMLSNNKKVINIYEKPIELMTQAERDEHFLSSFRMSYDDFVKEYCNKGADIGANIRKHIDKKYKP